MLCREVTIQFFSTSLELVERARRGEDRGRVHGFLRAWHLQLRFRAVRRMLSLKRWLPLGRRKSLS